jgi:enoyl-CoA hydratase
LKGRIVPHALPNASCDCTSDRSLTPEQIVSEDHLLIDRSDAVLTLTVNRPEQRNALRMDLLDAIGAALDAHADDESLKVAVITAAGDRCFAAGGDLKELDAIRTPEQTEAMSQRGRMALDSVRNFPLPVVGALNGLALGGGAELAMACDLRVAAANAEIGFLQGQLAVTTAWGGGIDLIATVGPQRGLDLLISARRLDTAEAQTLGLFDRVCTDGENLDTCLTDFLTPYLARSRHVLEGFKSLTADYRRTLHERLAVIEEERFITAWTSDEHWAAVAQAAAGRRKK